MRHENQAVTSKTPNCYQSTNYACKGAHFGPHLRIYNSLIFSNRTFQSYIISEDILLLDCIKKTVALEQADNRFRGPQSVILK